MIEGRTALEHNRHSTMRWPSDSLNYKGTGMTRIQISNTISRIAMTPVIFLTLLSGDGS